MNILLVTSFLAAVASNAAAAKSKCAPRTTTTTTSSAAYYGVSVSATTSQASSVTATTSGTITKTLTLTTIVATSASSPTTTTAATTISLPAAPTGLGFVDTAPTPTVLPFVDYAYTNVRNDACHVNVSTNAGVRLLVKYLDIWTPSTEIVDAGVTLPADGSCPAVVASNWTGIPGDPTDGHVVNQAVHEYNIQLAINTTTGETAADILAAYLDNNRQKGYSVTDGFGPLTDIWRNLTEANTTITSIAANANTTAQSDGGNNLGVAGTANPEFGTVVTFLNSISNIGASTEPPKRFYKYARPFRWSSKVIVPSVLVPAESTTPSTDGGFPSGHAAEGHRDALGMAYLVPQRFQELFSRAAELGFDRILAGMHSPLDVMGGARHGIAVAAANIYADNNANATAAAVNQSQTVLSAVASAAGYSSLLTFAHSATVATDRFADRVANKALYKYRLTYGFPRLNLTDVTPAVPKAAEVLLETRLPYLTADQRRVVLKSTAIEYGYPLLDDDEGWGRLNYFDAADGYGSFDGDVTVTLDASQGGFSAADSWNNDISGAGLLTKLGSGALTLTGTNSYSGGTIVQAGSLIAESQTALGTGAVYVSGGSLVVASTLQISVYTQLNSVLEISSGSFLSVSGLAFFGVGSVLVVDFASTPAIGSSVTMIQAATVYGTFTNVTVNGATGTVKYTATSVVIAF
ncbi:hypothetical protein HK100_007479 [Physocladia obscura]|uniref:Phosphatidic acid phosphatase type 2/haloperoxidase domain-containing protein n=1 Tax=Physocladia obscura TaxID=109957 RepID=A0AAD5XK10_9FUNG|nr:hypothetical protein HK100_007479 [Physocladia obscura]